MSYQEILLKISKINKVKRITKEMLNDRKYDTYDFFRSSSLIHDNYINELSGIEKTSLQKFRTNLQIWVIKKNSRANDLDDSIFEIIDSISINMNDDVLNDMISVFSYNGDEK
jgi:hypothetical protein